jgi:hypothetical protein
VEAIEGFKTRMLLLEHEKTISGAREPGEQTEAMRLSSPERLKGYMYFSSGISGKQAW